MSIPKSIPTKYRNRIAHWDDERSYGNSLIITLRGGWCFPHLECHVAGVDTIQQALSDLRQTAVCTCPECQEELSYAK